jgi:hypothetical protein
MIRHLRFILPGVLAISIIGAYLVWSATEDRGQRFSTNEIAAISKSIAAIMCSGRWIDGRYEGPIVGSATYMALGIPTSDSEDKIAVFVTNAHVAQLHSDSSFDRCGIDFSANGQIVRNPDLREAIYAPATVQFTETIDLALLLPQATQRSQLAEHLLSLQGQPIPACVQEGAIGSLVYLFGYPSASETADYPSDRIPSYFEFKQYLASRHLIVSEGLVSGRQGDDYFTTALVDTGSSGGLAVMKQHGRACVLGIPTWAVTGELTSLGVIQSFANLYRADLDWESIEELYQQQ